jgi:AraC family transcriptional regulator, ethanolamine operon transcriptional activator
MNKVSTSTFSHILQAEFFDVDEMCATVKSWNLDFEPLESIVGKTTVGSILQSNVAGMEFGHARFSTNLEQHGAAPVGAITFVVMETTMQRPLWWRGQDTDCRDILAYPVNSEVYSLSPSDFDVHTISVPVDICQAICEANKIHISSFANMPEIFRPNPTLLNNLRHALRLLQMESAAPGAAEAKIIAETLVCAWARAHMPKVHRRPKTRMRSLAMVRIMECFEDADWVDLTPAALCSYAQVSERTLQYAFQERFGMTPGKFLKARRLAAVRSALKDPDVPAKGVGAVAEQFNFWHVGQFAADYRRAFGELPSQTLLHNSRYC